MKIFNIPQSTFSVRVRVHVHAHVRIHDPDDYDLNDDFDDDQHVGDGYVDCLEQQKETAN